MFKTWFGYDFTRVWCVWCFYGNCVFVTRFCNWFSMVFRWFSNVLFMTPFRVCLSSPQHLCSGSPFLPSLSNLGRIAGIGGRLVIVISIVIIVPLQVRFSKTAITRTIDIGFGRPLVCQHFLARNTIHIAPGLQNDVFYDFYVFVISKFHFPPNRTCQQLA